MSLLQTRLRWHATVRSGRPAQLRVAVLSTFTADPIIPYLGTALEDAGLPSDVWIGPYNQVVQQCVLDESETARYNPDVLLILPRLEELWSRRPMPLADTARSTYGHELSAMADACVAAAERWSASLVFALPPVPEASSLGVGDACTSSGVHATASAVREEVRRSLAGRPGVLIADLEDVVRHIGSGRVYNWSMLAVGRIPFSEDAFALMGERLARLVALSRRSARKAVAIDADNTLWGGVVGEEGPDGIDLGDNGPGEAYRAFQSYMLELRRVGVLLTLSSKNNEADVWDAFGRREMVLKREHLSAWRINWRPKSENLQELAAELNLGLDSFVLIDDSPVEIAEVQTMLPQVEGILMPEDPAGWLPAIQNSGLLDRLPPTVDDLQRAERYQQERARQDVAQSAASRGDYLARLEVQVDIYPPEQSDLSRLTQMVNKTNQFNLNCRRRDSSQLSTLLADPTYLVRVVQAEDRFGEYGLVGAYIVKVCADHALLDTFLLSCRAMGRGVEQAMLADLFDSLPANCDSRLLAVVEEQPRNHPARDFFAKMGCPIVGEECAVLRPEWPQHIHRHAVTSNA